MLKTFFILFTSIFLVSCVTTTHIKAVKTKGMQVIYKDNKKVFTSKKTNSLVSLAVYTPVIKNLDDEKLYFLINFKNLSPKPVIVSAKNISVTQSNLPLFVLDYGTWMKEKKKLKDYYSFRQALHYTLTRAEKLEKIKEEIKSLGTMYLKKNTVAPNSSIEGLIAVETLSLSSEKAYYTVTIRLNKDTHKFRVLRTKE